MNKKEVQQRILKNGKPLDISLFEWDEKTNTFSTTEKGLVIDFSNINNCTFNTGSDCTFDTGLYCIFNTSSDCTFTTGSHCIFNTGSYCTFNTGCNCTFKTGYDSVIVRRDFFQIITLTEKENNITLCPNNIKGYVKDGIYSETGKPSIITDGILSEILSKKTINDLTVYNVINHSEDHESYLVQTKDNIYSHGKTIKETKDSLIYKIKDRDTTPYKEYKLDTIITYEEAIRMYRTITGACEYGVRSFVESLDIVPEKLSIKEIINITKNKYGNDTLTNFFN